MAIYATVVRRPGQRPAYIARQQGLARSAVTRLLPALDDAGLLLSEYHHRLYPFTGENHQPE
jgi:DNA-binding IclR family transcriptional regulator